MTGFRSDEVGDDGLLFFLLYAAIIHTSFGGQFDLMFIPGMEVECREGEIILAALAIINLIYLL